MKSVFASLDRLELVLRRNRTLDSGFERELLSKVARRGFYLAMEVPEKLNSRLGLLLLRARL